MNFKWIKIDSDKFKSVSDDGIEEVYSMTDLVSEINTLKSQGQDADDAEYIEQYAVTLARKIVGIGLGCIEPK